MARIFWIVLLCCTTSLLSAQDKAGAEKLVAEGVDLNDKGDLDGAIAKYDAGLALDKDNLLCLSEKAYTLRSLKKYVEAVELCKKAVALYPAAPELKSVYVSYASSLDNMEKYPEALLVYEEGIKVFPDFYLLYFNKAINLASTEKLDDAALCLQKSILLNPKHASSHVLLARVLAATHQRIPAVLVMGRFLVLEPKGKRAETGLKALHESMNGNVKKTGKNNITITVSQSMLGDSTGGKKENDFHSIDLILSLSSALDYDKKNKNKSEVELFSSKMDMICSSLQETKKDNSGFYWDYYAPYFIAMKEKDLVQTFAYIIHASDEDKSVQKWLQKHPDKIKAFLEWSVQYEWKKG